MAATASDKGPPQGIGVKGPLQDHDTSVVSVITESEGDKTSASTLGLSLSDSEIHSDTSSMETVASLINGTVKHASICSSCHGDNMGTSHTAAHSAGRINGGIETDDDDAGFIQVTGKERKRKISAAATSPADASPKRTRSDSTAEVSLSKETIVNKESKKALFLTSTPNGKTGTPGAHRGGPTSAKKPKDKESTLTNKLAAAADGKQQTELSTMVLYIKGVGCNLGKHVTNNPIAFGKQFDDAVGAVKSLKVVRDCLRVTCHNIRQVAALLQTTDLAGKTIKVSKPWNKKAAGSRGGPIKHQIKGIIFGVSPNVTEADIAAAVNGVAAQRVTKWINGAKTPTANVVLAFDGDELPKVINIGCLVYKVKPYIPPVIVCTRCQNFGHNPSRCTAQERCVRCATIGHGIMQCPIKDKPQEAKCVRCGGNHSAAYKGCAKYKEVKKALSKVVKEGLTFRDALINVRLSVQPLQNNDVAVTNAGPPAAPLAAAAATSSEQPKEQRPPRDNGGRLNTRGEQGKTTQQAPRPAAAAPAQAVDAARQKQSLEQQQRPTSNDRHHPAAATAVRHSPPVEQNVGQAGPANSCSPLEPALIAASINYLLESILLIDTVINSEMEPKACIIKVIGCLRSKLVCLYGTHDAKTPCLDPLCPGRCGAAKAAIGSKSSA